VRQKVAPIFCRFLCNRLEFQLEILQIYLWKRSTSNSQVKYDSVENQHNYIPLNMAAYRFFSIKNVQAKMLFNFQKPVTTLLLMTSQ